MSDIAGQLLLQLILILLNAFFAATEIAVISLNEKKVKARADDGDKKAKKMLKMIEEPTRFLSTIQIGITAFSARHSLPTTSQRGCRALPSAPLISPRAVSV